VHQVGKKKRLSLLSVLRGERKLQVFVYKVSRIMLGPKKDETSNKLMILGDDPVHKPHPAICPKL